MSRASGSQYENPFVATFKGGPSDGLQIAARFGPVPSVLWVEVDPVTAVVRSDAKLYRYERSSDNGGVTWIFEFTGHVLSDSNAEAGTP